jgi:hypothetical protein
MSSSRSWIRGLLLDNIGLKIVSLLIAVLLWVVIAGAPHIPK